MNDPVPRSNDAGPLVRSLLTRSALIFCAAFMVGWFIFLICGIIYFELLLN